MTAESCRLWFAQYTTDTETPSDTLRDFQVAIFAQDQPVLESQQPKALPLSGGEAMSAADRLSAAYRRYLKAQGIGFGTC
jgi:phenylpropionate dioxygenase-like ring-hydroxylating dioxygenase large terminal subunit